MPYIQSSHAGGITTLVLDSPANRNALSTALMRELLAGLSAAVADDATRAVVLDHTGTVFCSGADLSETAAAASSGDMPANMMGDLLAAVAESPKPVVAVVGGAAPPRGGGRIAAAPPAGGAAPPPPAGWA